MMRIVVKGLVGIISLMGVGFAVEPVLYPKNVLKSEFSFSAGGLFHSGSLRERKRNEKMLEDTYYIRAGLDYRAKYPFLIGFGVKYSSTNVKNGSMELIENLSLDLRLKGRKALISYLKADLVGGAVISRMETRHRSKNIGGGYGGVEFLYWFSGVYAGLSFTYHAFSDERFNHIQTGMVVGF